MNSDYVQYGCGWSAPAGWRNFDASPTLRFERIPFIGRIYTRNISRFPKNVEYGDIVKGLPVPGNSCRGVYCSHVLEHLSWKDFARALKNTYRIIADEGCFRLVVPDLEYSIKKYCQDLSSGAAIEFMRETGLGMVERPRGLRCFMRSCLGNSEHLWMWDYKAIENELKAAGFGSVRRATFGDAADPMFRTVEDENRWKHCLGVECWK